MHIHKSCSRNWVSREAVNNQIRPKISSVGIDGHVSLVFFLFSFCLWLLIDRLILTFNFSETPQLLLLTTSIIDRPPRTGQVMARRQTTSGQWPPSGQLKCSRLLNNLLHKRKKVVTWAFRWTCRCCCCCFCHRRQWWWKRNRK